MPKAIRVLVIICLFFCLVLVRAFQHDLFYDPFLSYFEGNLLHDFPEVNTLKLLISYLVRFSINGCISILILKISFPKNTYLKTIACFYVLAFVVLAMLFFGILVCKLNVGYLLPFYIRRFIIQPIFVLILFPFLFLLNRGYRF